MKYLLFDVSGTLLYKPNLYPVFADTLSGFDIEVKISDLKYHHKLLSEVIKFPDKTDEKFYKRFNAELLISLGICPEKTILNQLFKNCSYLPWERFLDTSVLNKLNNPKGILSNFNSSLEEKLFHFFGNVFKDVFVSEIEGVSKPSTSFFEIALEKLNLNADQIIYIGDSFKLDYLPASKLGITAFIIDRDRYYPDSNFVLRSLDDIESKIIPINKEEF